MNADRALEEARGEQEKIKEKHDKIMEERSQLQVCTLAIFLCFLLTLPRLNNA